MKILVTGGAGYLGSHTALALLAAGSSRCVLTHGVFRRRIRPVIVG